MYHPVASFLISWTKSALSLSPCALCSILPLNIPVIWVHGSNVRVLLRHHPPDNFSLHVKNVLLHATYPWLLDMMTNNVKSLTKGKFVTTQPLQLINNLLIFLLEDQVKVKGTFWLEEPKQIFILFLRWWWQWGSWKALSYLLSLLQSFLLHWHFFQLYACFIGESHIQISGNDIILFFQCWIKDFTLITVKKINNWEANLTLWKLKNNKPSKSM